MLASYHDRCGSRASANSRICPAATLRPRTYIAAARSCDRLVVDDSDSEARHIALRIGAVRCADPTVER